jgi:hypothetical protein
MLRVLNKMRVNYCVRISPTLVTIQKQMNTAHIIQSYLFKMRFNSILHLRLGLGNVSFLQL